MVIWKIIFAKYVAKDLVVNGILTCTFLPGTHEKKEYPCNKCDKVFSSLPTQKRHICNVHERKRVYCCSICGKEFSKSDRCKQHIKGVHLGEPVRVHKCNICCETFKTKQFLGKHKLTHKNEKPFECSCCNQQFESKEDLRHDMLEHGGEFYCCPHCNIGFSSRSDLDKHWVIHRGHPIICQECNDVFPNKTVFGFHNHKFVPVKRLNCPLCDAYILRKCLLIHVKRKHPL